MDVHDQFNKFKEQNSNHEMVALLENYKKSDDLSVDEIGWVYWNISDGYALLRNPEHEFRNHLKFFEWGKENLYPNKLHWIVSDATQALTLSLGHYFKRWEDWYLFACKHSTKSESNRGGRFESHRATAASMIKLKKTNLLDTVLSNMQTVIQEDEKWENASFSRIAYYSLLLERHSLIGKDKEMDQVLSHIDSFTNDEILTTFESQDQVNSLLGSWSNINGSRNSQQSILVALNNLGCSLGKIKRFNQCTKVFNFVIRHGHQLNQYGTAMYLSSIWNDEKDREAVLRKYKTLRNSRYHPSELYRFSPELREVFGN
jgi:hypothetical protein